jgi:UDP-N-acetylmuramate dehydrogenase
VEVQRDALGLAYRRSIIAELGLIILEATFDLKPGDSVQISRTVREYTARRKDKQPFGVRTCGSVFKNPSAGYPAGRLLEEAGAKDMAVGGARVSPKHANWIENSGGASASDIRELIMRLQKLVEEKSGVRLEPEVQIAGEW